MKAHPVTLLACSAVLVFCLAGCGGSPASSSSNAASSASSAASSAAASSSAAAANSAAGQLTVNFVECTSMQDAAKEAGFGMDAPEDIAGSSLKCILASADKPVIEIDYTKDGTSVSASLRKAPESGNNSDISGDTTQYAESGTVKSAGDGSIEAATRGKDGRVHVMTWKRDGYVFAMVATAGISPEAAAEVLDAAF